MSKKLIVAPIAALALAAAAPAVAGAGVGNPNPGTPPATAPGPSANGTWTFKDCPGTVLVSPIFGGAVVGTPDGVYGGATLVDEGFNNTTPTCATADYVVFGGRVTP
jgi:hypothetical protein